MPPPRLTPGKARRADHAAPGRADAADAAGAEPGRAAAPPRVPGGRVKPGDRILVDGNARGSFTLEPNGTVVLRTRWCSGHSTAHITQHRYKGTDPDGNPLVLTGPVVQLLGR
mgnify:CR=1 FL=1